MIFASILIIIFNCLIFLIENIFANNIFAFEIAFCCFTWVGIFAYKINTILNVPKKEKHINLNLYKLRKPNLSVFFVFLYLICFISTLFLLKVYRSVREVSVKQLYLELLNFFSPLTIGQKTCTILFGLTLVYLAILFTKKLKNFIFKESIKVHLYLLANPMYLDYILQPMVLNSYLSLISFLIAFFRSKVNFLNQDGFCTLIRVFVEYLVFILILSFVCFDFWFNAFVLTKVFYILPACFLYSQWLYMSKFYISKDILLDNLIHKYLYKKIFFEDQNIIMFDDGRHTIENETRQEINNYIEKGFRTF